jgi:hypothetical protein
MGGTHMSIKKTVAIAAAAGALAAVAAPAMAVENEFHGMYTFAAYQSNFFEGTTLSAANAAALLRKDAKAGFFAEQRARVQYIAKANADLKLVTHFELDSRFGGSQAVGTGYKGTYTGNDSGNIDADQLTLETKSVYLDVNCPITGANVKVGMQPWADSYQSLFLLADMTGVYATKGFGSATASLGWFRFADRDAVASLKGPAKEVADLIVLDGKYAVNKDIKVGASYYNIQNNTPAVGALTVANINAATTSTALPYAKVSSAAPFELLHMIGLNADINVGPANIKPFAAFQFGDISEAAKTTMSGMLLGATSKTKVGAGAVNASAIYMSGDSVTSKYEKSFKTVGANFTYFNAANMWLLVRNANAVNSSTSILGNDMTAGGAGLLGLFAGYEGTMDKVFYNANIGYAQTDKAIKANGKTTIGTELNAQVGYKVYDNLTASAAVAYAILGDAIKSKTTGTSPDADDPYAVNLMVSYKF